MDVTAFTANNFNILNAASVSLIVLLDLLAILVFAGILLGFRSGEKPPNSINLSCLLSEAGEGGQCGPASMAKLQFLVFTFVIAIGFFLILTHNLAHPPTDGKFWPDLPAGVLTLLGISGTSSLVSQGLSNAKENGMQQIRSQEKIAVAREAAKISDSTERANFLTAMNELQ